MRGIVENVLYDTETATQIATGTQKPYQSEHPGTIYRTPNGRFFRVGEGRHFHPMDKDYVADWIAQNVPLTDDIVKLLVDEFGLEIG